MHRPAFIVLLTSLSPAFAQLSQDSISVPGEYADDSTFQSTILEVSNLYRREHNASSLAWNRTLAEYADVWSKDCKFKHSDGTSGENLASGYPNATASVEAWGSERNDYNFKKGAFSSATGHFTQLVWRNTTTVGCARTECNGGQKGGKGDAPGWYIVCEYYPAGNVLTQFTANVLPQLPSDEVPSASDPPSASVGPSATATPQSAASAMMANAGNLCLALGIALVAVVYK